MKTLSIQQQFTVSYEYPVIFSRDCFHLDNPTVGELVQPHSDSRPKALVLIDENVLKGHSGLSQQIKHYFLAHDIELAASILGVTGGEQIKNEDDLLPEVYQLVADAAIDRHSYILAIGGGAVIDAVGYAAATAHRGVRLIRMPSTVLGQNDAGIGVKNGVNYAGRKNFLGTFAPPFAVINDELLLNSLDGRDKRAGVAEAVKVALIKDKQFFDKLYRERKQLAEFEAIAMSDMIYRCAELHLDHIRNNGDPFELGSARPLDFGHWSAHKLEALSNYKLRHGEAVAVGVALDLEYSKTIGFITSEECSKAHELLLDLGFELAPQELRLLDVHGALEEFREHIGGQLCITLVKGIGQGVEVASIQLDAMQASVDALLANFGISQVPCGQSSN